MNTPFNEYSAGDVARMLKVDKSTITLWCRKGLIVAKSVSEGAKNARWLIPEKEAEYLRKLCKQYGKRGIMKHYERVGEDLLSPLDETSVDISKLPTTEDENISPIEQTAVSIEETVSTKPTKKFDVDEVALQLARIQEIREELEDIEARKNQLTYELEDLRKEILEFI